MAAPLNLTPFEWSMTEAFAGHCVSFHMRFEFRGVLDPTSLRLAVRDAQTMHPLLASLLNGCGRTNDYRWQWAPDVAPHMAIEKSPADFRFPLQERIDLTREVGFRVWAADDDGQIEIWFQFHHACCDGMGALRFVEDVLWCYDQILSRTSVSRSSPYDNHTLHSRDPPIRGGLSLRDQWTRSGWVLPRRLGEMFLQKPRQFQSIDSETESHAPSNRMPTFPSLVLPTTLVDALGGIARGQNVQLNDLLLRDLFLTLHHAPTSIAGDHRRGAIRILIPFSLRTAIHKSMPAANCVSMAYMNADDRVLQRPEKLLISLAQQMDFIRRWKLQYSWNQSLALIASSKFLAWWLTRSRHRVLATGVFSNVGRIFRKSKLRRVDGKIVAGQLQLEFLRAVPPVNAQLNLAAGSLSYAGAICLSLNGHAATLGEESTTRILHHWADRLRQTARVP